MNCDKINLEMEQNKALFIGDVDSSMVKLCGNTTNKEYAGFTDQIIAVSKNGQTIVLEPEDLRKLEQVIGGKFRR